MLFAELSAQLHLYTKGPLNWRHCPMLFFSIVLSDCTVNWRKDELSCSSSNLLRLQVLSCAIFLWFLLFFRLYRKGEYLALL